MQKIVFILILSNPSIRRRQNDAKDDERFTERYPCNGKTKYIQRAVEL